MAAGVEDLAEMQAIVKREIRREKGIGEYVAIHTRNSPKRIDELLDGGSVYSVIRSIIQIRRKILDIRKVEDSDGTSYCKIFLEPQLIRVLPVAQKPFQGWRYLDPAKAPRDLGILRDNADDDMPAEMANELKALGLL